MRNTPAMTARPRSPADSVASESDRPTAVVFDLGGVLVDWDPRHLYRSLFDDEAEMERFLAEVTTPAWNYEQDRGRPFAEAIAELTREHPDQAELIEAYWTRWPETLGEPFHETVEILADLRTTGIRLLALTNWSAETFPFAMPRYPFLAWFEAVIVSGEVELAKPDPAIFQLLVDRHGLEPARTVLIDDSAANIEAATSLGFLAIRFTGAADLRRDLSAMGLLEG
jgi:2-haloacid dehalogenase